MAGLKHVKDGVRFEPCSSDLVDGAIRASAVLSRFNYDLVITSGSDGVHPAGGKQDPHYLGYAFDIRTRDMKIQDVPTVVRDLRLVLGKDWTIVQESDHIHLQCNKFRALVNKEADRKAPA